MAIKIGAENRAQIVELVRGIQESYRRMHRLPSEATDCWLLNARTQHASFDNPLRKLSSKDIAVAYRLLGLTRSSLKRLIIEERHQDIKENAGQTDPLSTSRQP